MLGAQCTENPPALGSSSAAEAEGHIEEIGGRKAYVTGHHQDSNLAVLLLSDAFDKIAASGFLVVAPDFFYGDPFGRGKSRESWLEAHSPDKGCEDAKIVIDDLRSKGVSKIGVAGFCWGGKINLRLAKFDCIQAAVLLHPGPITEEEINEVKIPIAILGAEIDEHAPPELLQKLGDILSAKAEVDSFVKIFPGVGHGWTVRYNEGDEFAVKSAQESHLDLLNWLTKYIN
ncbi:alpha/beta-Hydrolases superfamily protein [Striga hermonthica]|uniref:Alpha/beta-Hydrolases superfamily protein n=1 Tax=Striga hermonthica TaxID=68872 RepID=A0A9N7P057_STRHE|nr:alpha/beta-Hydrolases superfamily protein [Striga hermonthica]